MGTLVGYIQLKTEPELTTSRLLSTVIIALVCDECLKLFGDSGEKGMMNILLLDMGFTLQT